MLALLCVVSLGFISCGSDDDDDELPAKPVITLTEVGHDNSKHAHPGHDLHLEADVVAEGLIKSINIEIHQENGGTMKINISVCVILSSMSISTYQLMLH